MADANAPSEIDPALMAAAQDLAAARAAHDAAAAAVSAAVAESNARRSRLAALDGKRAAIVTRRQRGEQLESDGADLALVAGTVSVRSLEGSRTAAALTDARMGDQDPSGPARAP